MYKFYCLATTPFIEINYGERYFANYRGRSPVLPEQLSTFSTVEKPKESILLF